MASTAFVVKAEVTEYRASEGHFATKLNCARAWAINKWSELGDKHPEYSFGYRIQKFNSKRRRDENGKWIVTTPGDVLVTFFYMKKEILRATNMAFMTANLGNFVEICRKRPLQDKILLQ